MGQRFALDRFITRIKEGLSWLWHNVTLSLALIRRLFSQIWIWLRLRLPFVEALVTRQLDNPASFFIDIAVLILVLYVLFGISGAALVYGQKSENRFTETLAILYPLPAARVNGSFVWSHRFLQRLRFLNTFNAHAPASVTARPPTDKELRRQVLEGLIEDQIILLEAGKRDVKVTQAELDAAFNKQAEQNPNFSQKIKELYGMSVTEFRDVLAEQILKQKIKGVVVTQVHIDHILTTTLDAASQAKKQLDSGKSFAEVAKQFSQDANSKDNGGDLGYWTKGELAAQIGQNFEDATFSLPVGQVSSPIQTQFGYHLIKVVDKTGNNYQTYTDWLAQTEKGYHIVRYVQY